MNTNWKIVRLSQSTDASGVTYEVQLQMVPSPTNRQQGNVTLTSTTPFTGLTIGESIAATFAGISATPAE